MRTTKINWLPIIGGHEDKWRSAYARLHADSEHYPWVTRLWARCKWAPGLPTALVDDEGWAVDSVPGHGCTSVSSDAGFGRNLDYCYPENASELIYHTTINVGGRELVIEGFTGLLGWLAFRGDDSCGAFNQAPPLRKLRRTKTPALFLFREYSLLLDSMAPEHLPASGDVMVDRSASDFLLHFSKGDRRFIGEYFDGQLVWEAVRDKAVQANTYQILDLEAEDPEWTEDSLYRMEEARRARGIKASLDACANEWTADSVVLRGRGAIMPGAVS